MEYGFPVRLDSLVIQFPLNVYDTVCYTVFKVLSKTDKYQHTLQHKALSLCLSLSPF